jgi:hypothetical protein
MKVPPLYPLSRSRLKTWLRKQGYQPHGYRQCWRHCWRFGVFKKGDRLYRFRDCGRIVDVSEPLAKFDRWANSSEYRAVPQQLFIAGTYCVFV